MRFLPLFALILAAFTLSACLGSQGSGQMSSASVPPMAWDHHPQAPEWTKTTLQSVQKADPVLAAVVPKDIAAWCPAYPKADLAQRRAFWAGLMSTVAKYESTWNPKASGGGGRWIGLMQIAPKSAKYYGCAAHSREALKDGAANLACAVEIAAVQIGRDAQVAGGGALGMGRDWAPFRNAQKRAAMAEWTRAQSYCQESQGL